MYQLRCEPPYLMLQMPPMPAGMPDIATLTREIMESDPEAMAQLKRYEEAVVRLEKAQVGALPPLWLKPAPAADTCSANHQQQHSRARHAKPAGRSDARMSHSAAQVMLPSRPRRMWSTPLCALSYTQPLCRPPPLSWRRSGRRQSRMWWLLRRRRRRRR